jgi:hypothetical protein
MFLLRLRTVSAERELKLSDFLALPPSHSGRRGPYGAPPAVLGSLGDSDVEITV